MKKIAILGVACASLSASACASNPRQTLLDMDSSSPLYNTPACAQAREAALAYNDKVISRMGMGMALGLLGPVGLIGAVALDANQNNERQMLNDILARDCGIATAETDAAAAPEPEADEVGATP